MSKFDINYRVLVRRLVPYFLRGTKFIEYLVTCTYPLNVLNNTFSTFRDNTYQFLIHDSRRIYLEKRLNDLYDITLRRITVTNNSSADVQTYLYKKSEGEVDTFLFKKSELSLLDTYLYKKSETLNDAGFIIDVPVSVSTSDTVIERTLNQYVTSGKAYIINRV
jgi:hypothetical protein